jgi:hypothetical protein
MAPEIYDPERHGPLLDPAAAIKRLWQEHAIKLGQQRLADLRSRGGPQFIKPTLREVRHSANLLDEWASARNCKPVLGFVPINPAASSLREAQADVTTTTKAAPPAARENPRP